MDNQKLAAKLSNDIKKRRTVRAVNEAFSELYEETGGDFEIVNEVVNIMDDELQNVSILNEQFENKGQLNAMSQLHQIVAKAQKSANSKSRDTGKKY